MIAWMYRLYHNSKNFISWYLRRWIWDSGKYIAPTNTKKSFSGRIGPKLKVLKPLENKNGFLKAKTSIIHNNKKEDFRYPVILPSHQPVALKLSYGKILEHHHAGNSILMAQLDEIFFY